MPDQRDYLLEAAVGYAWALLVIAILEVGVPALFGYVVWRVLGLDKAPLSLG